MEAILQKISDDGAKRVSIYYATDTDNPRSWLVYSHMVCDHPQYFLGDGDHLNCENELRTLCNNYDIDWERDGDEMSIYEMFMAVSEYVVIRPIGVYDHSGITVYYGSPWDRWDSCCVGFGYMEKSDVEDAHGPVSDDEWRDLAISIMDAEMKTYDRFVRGQVYGYVLEERKSPSKALTETPEWAEFLEDYWNEEFQWEETDSCWGYYEEPDELADLVLTDKIY